MSAPEFRAAILGTLAAEWTATEFFDLSEYTALEDIPASGEATILLVQFIAEQQRFATIATAGRHGWSATGVFMFHLWQPLGRPSSEVLELAEALRDRFRGRRFGAYLIDTLDPATDFSGGAVGVYGKWHGWILGGSYQAEICNGS